jgi:ankyrin repeat protein
MIEYRIVQSIPGCRVPVAILLAAILVWTGMTQSAHSQSSPARDMLDAAARGDTARIEKLIADGAPLDPLDSARQTPLLLAVQGNHLATVEMLIKAGANINAQAANMDTPWLLAGALGRTDMLRLMIPRGPDFSIRNRFGGNALMPACERAHVDTVKLLLTTRIDVDHVNNLGWTCLLEIVILGDGGPAHVEVARLVLSAGANPNIADKDGVSPLAHARRKGQGEIAQLIASAGGR